MSNNMFKLKNDIQQKGGKNDTRKYVHFPKLHRTAISIIIDNDFFERTILNIFNEYVVNL